MTFIDCFSCSSELNKGDEGTLRDAYKSRNASNSANANMSQCWFDIAPQQFNIIHRTLLDLSDENYSENCIGLVRRLDTDYLPVLIGSISMILKRIQGGSYNFSKLTKSIGVRQDALLKLSLIFTRENDSSDTSKDSPIFFIAASDCRLVSIWISLTIVA